METHWMFSRIYKSALRWRTRKLAIIREPVRKPGVRDHLSMSYFRVEYGVFEPYTSRLLLRTF